METTHLHWIGGGTGHGTKAPAMMLSVRSITLLLPCLVVVAVACSDGILRPRGIGPAAVGATSTSTASGLSSGAGGQSAAGGGGTGPACGELVLEPAVCQSCLETACCQALISCAPDSDCAALRMCLADCGTASCKDGCLQKHGGGAEALSELEDCVLTQCEYECEGWPVCNSGYTTSSQACSTCLADNCCEATTSCSVDFTCRDCLAGDAEACDETSLDEAFLACQDSECADVCPPG